MAINFPNNPSNSDTFDAAGVTFVYNSTKNTWTPQNPVDTVASQVTTYATIDDLPLSNQTSGAQAFVSSTNRLYIWNGNGWYNIALINTTPSISGVNSSYELANDGTATVITITATDPEGLPITYSIASDTSGDIATVTQGTGANTNIFTITPSTNAANAGTFSLTFRASDGVNLATALASFELQFTIINSNYTTALITSVGTNNATNSLVADNSTNDYGFALDGTNSTQGTFSPYRHGGYSTYFDGSSSLSVTNTGSTLAFGTGDVTVEGWINQSAAVNTQYGILAELNVSGVGPVAFWYNGTVGTGAEFRLGAADVTQMIGFRADTPINEWFHFAYVRESGTWKFYLNGTEITTRNTDVGDADGYSFANFNPNIGSFTNGLNMAGYMTDLRVVVGTAVYTTNFTRPTKRLTAVTNTQLLACHLPYIADGSTNSHSITINGSTKTEPFAPYDSQTYTAADHGSSYYFGGLGNHVASTSGTGVAAPGGGDFCLEFWVYPTSSGVSSLFDYRPYNANPASGLLLFKDASNRPYLYSNGAQRILATDGIAVNVWSHVAVTRNSGTHYLYVNGKQQSGTWTDSTTWTTGAYRPIFMQSGYHAAGNSPGNYYNTTGNMTDIRLVTGSSVYTTDFTPSTSPLTAITNTQLLLNAERAGIIDKSQSVKTLTLNGDVKSSTTQTKYLSSSMYFDGTGDYVTLPASNELVMGAGDFTIEAWVYLDSLTDTRGGQDGVFVEMRSSGANSTGFVFNCRTSATDFLLNFYTDGGPNVAATGLSYSTWHHVAVTRESGTIRLFANGTVDKTFTKTNNFSDSPNITIGQSTLYSSSSIVGYMSDLRITKGLARYTANFTPPTAALKG